MESAAGEDGGRGDVGNVGLGGTPEDLGRSRLAVFGGISIFDITGGLSSLTMVDGIFTRLGFLARSLVGYNVAKQT